MNFELGVVTEKVKGRDVDYLYISVDGKDICVGYIDKYGRLHIKNK